MDSITGSAARRLWGAWLLYSVQQLARLFVAAFVACICAAASVVHAQQPTADNPVEARARQFARAVSTGDPQELQRLVTEAFGAEMQKIPMPSHMAILTSFWDMSRGLEFDRLQGLPRTYVGTTSAPNPGEAIAAFSNRLTGGRNAIFFRVEQEPPHRIVTVRALPGPRSLRTSALRRPLASGPINRCYCAPDGRRSCCRTTCTTPSTPPIW